VKTKIKNYPKEKPNGYRLNNTSFPMFLIAKNGFDKGKIAVKYANKCKELVKGYKATLEMALKANTENTYPLDILFWNQMNLVRF
jgi:hypothetical protein